MYHVFCSLDYLCLETENVMAEQVETLKLLFFLEMSLQCGPKEFYVGNGIILLSVLAKHLSNNIQSIVAPAYKAHGFVQRKLTI